MNKTVKVRVNTTIYDKKVHKEVLKRNHYLVHDEGNVCKEGDIVRIEQIPKILARKYFAIAEIKVNKGQQFAQYEAEAKVRVADEHKQKLAEFEQHKDDIMLVVTKIDDLRDLEVASKQLEGASDEMAADLVSKIDAIRAKYGIKLWPTTEPVVHLELDSLAREVDESQYRLENVTEIVNKVLADDALVGDILTKLGKAPGSVKKHTQKNLVRKYVLDVKNELPVTL